MTTVEALKEARARIEKGWIQRQSYRNEPEAWCASGALDDSHGATSHGCVGCRAEDLFITAVGTDEIAVWNDAPERTQAEVLAAFDKAIALAEKETA